MNIVVVDNYDSFTHNLVHYLERLGVNVEVVRNKITVVEIEKMSPDKIVISPGPCSPMEAGVSCDVIRHFAGKIPILGVCLGHQCIGEVFGGKIVRAKKPMHGKVSEVIHLGTTKLFKGLKQGFQAVRYHSLVIEQASLSSDLMITALSADDGEIMGIKHRTLPVEGVQFHPEAHFSDGGLTILKNFLEG